MSATTTPSWSDLLGVPDDASADEIRTAWRSQIADLDPTDRRFAMLNRAAEVLLDPDRRAVHDAAAEPTTPSRGVSVVPGRLLAGLAVVTLAVVAVTAVVWMREPSAGAVEGDARAAQAAAERAVVPILSYDATNLDASRAAAQPYLTSDYREEYDKLFDGIIAQNAPATGTVLEADLVRSGIVRSGEERVQVFALVNQSRTNKTSTEPQVYQNWVTITMEYVDGDWLVASLDT